MRLVCRRVVVCGQTDIDLTGQIVWPGATFLARYLLHVRHRIAGHPVLEMGAGTGLCGLLCSQFASKVVLTDGIAEIVTLLQANLKYASPSCVDGVSAMALDWGSEEAHAALRAAHPQPFRIIIGADVLYPFFEGAIALLFQSLKVSRGLGAACRAGGGLELKVDWVCRVWRWVR